jgi:hypothetical protein
MKKTGFLGLVFATASVSFLSTIPSYAAINVFSSSEKYLDSVPVDLVTNQNSVTSVDGNSNLIARSRRVNVRSYRRSYRGKPGTRVRTHTRRAPRR